MPEIDLQKYLDKEIDLKQISFEPIETYCMRMTISGPNLKEHLDKCIVKALKKVIVQLEAKNK